MTPIIDEFDLDAEAIIEASKKKQFTSTFPKVTWHSLPKGNSVTNWRIYPCLPIKTFYVKVSKHWHIPGLGRNPGQDGTIQCPRSFTNAVGDKFACAMCDKYWFLKKGDETDQKISEGLKSQDQYYVNAESVDNPSLGMGVLALPYTVYNQLMGFLSVAHTRDFTHPIRGRNVTIKTQEANGFMPGTTNKKREYIVILGDREEVANPNESMAKVFDLSKIFAVPTFEFTQLALARMISSDATAGAEFLPEGTPKWISLNPPKEEPKEDASDEYYEDASFQVHTQESEPVKQVPVKKEAPEPKISNIPTTDIGEGGHRACYGIAFDMGSAICASCSELGGCAGEKMKRNTPVQTTIAPASNIMSESPVKSPNIKREEPKPMEPSNDMEAEMLRILNKSSF